MKEETNKKVVTRFPPSPTGLLHIGSARTALFNYLFAKKYGGSVLFRLEDTDTARSKKEFEESIVNGLSWLGLSFDNKMNVRQSERIEIYRGYLKKLFSSGLAYVSKEEVKEEGDRAEVIRFKNPNRKITFADIIRGEISFDTTELGDFVIAKSLEEPLYHLAVVVDDFEMGITHVIRGEDGLSNTPRQILIAEALGFPRTQYAHVPLILASDRSKMSKRHGATSIESYRNLGFLPEAIINFLALLGWNPGTEQEIFSLSELIEHFDLSKVQKGGAVFNIEKLKWFNKHYMQKTASLEKVKMLGSLYPTLLESGFSSVMKGLESKPAIVELMAERISTLAELRDIILSGEFDYFFGKPVYKKEALVWKGEGDFAKIKERLSKVLELVTALPAEGFDKDSVKNSVWAFAEAEGRGAVLWPMRVSLSGKEKSPDPFILSEMLGREETLSRISSAINLLS